MRKSSTYYFIVLAFLNLLFGYGLMKWTKELVQSYSILFGEAQLPPLTEMLIKMSGWPYLFVMLASIGTIISITTKIKSSTLNHFVITFWAYKKFGIYFLITCAIIINIYYCNHCNLVSILTIWAFSCSAELSI